MFTVRPVPLMVWLNLAYKAGQSCGTIDRTCSSRWTVGAWFMPFAKLVIPKLVENEVDTMLHPELTEPTSAFGSSDF